MQVTPHVSKMMTLLHVNLPRVAVLLQRTLNDPSPSSFRDQKTKQKEDLPFRKTANSLDDKLNDALLYP